MSRPVSRPVADLAGRPEGRLIRLPAGGCGHFLAGHCLYEEALNPGYHAAYRCRLLVRLQELYDSFLAQADAFGLDESSASDIWEKRFLELCREDTGCQAYEPGGIDQFPGCARCRGDVCVLNLPDCEGRCRHYTPKKQG